MRTNLLFCLMWLSVSLSCFAQGSLKGTLTDDFNGEPLIGASIFVENLGKGTVTDLTGAFKLNNITNGKSTLVINYVGYETKRMEVTVNGDTDLGAIALKSAEMGLEEVKVVASVAIDRKTPVAVSTIKSKEIEEKVGNQEFPELLRSTPSVYVTKQGGGFGDSRINLRGFDQRNIAVLINGVPVNDMENGWVYWSNWAGLSDVTRTMQVQRGLGASKLAIGAIGGTINIITKSADAERGGVAGVWVGNDGYLKGSLALNSGLSKGGWAFSFQGTRTVGDGYVNGTWIDAWSYFGSISKSINPNHQLVLTAVGAPQHHGQRDTKEKISVYDQRGEKYNSDYGYYKGEIFSFRENFYHKPQIALNHYWNINEKNFLTTSAYVSFGRGGGTGDIGRVSYKVFNPSNPAGTTKNIFLNTIRDENNLIDFDQIEQINTGTAAYAPAYINQDSVAVDAAFNEVDANGELAAIYARRSSMNEHNWYGVLSSLNSDLTDRLHLVAGVDLRYYKGLHYRRIEDLFGADYYLDKSDVNAPGGVKARIEDKVAYDNDGIVLWEGLFGQLEYTQSRYNLFAALSVSNTSYKRVDRFLYTPEQGQETDMINFFGYQAKAGANYNINENHNIFINTGYFSRAPLFRNVFPNNNNVVNKEAENEKVTALELGYGLRLSNFAANVNLYHTMWLDKGLYKTYTQGDQIYIANVLGLDALHQGVELDLVYSPLKNLNLKGMVSVGNWTWKNDVTAIVSDDNSVVIDTINVYADGLKVGDAAQTTFGVSVDYTFDFGLGFNAQFNSFDNLYAAFDPTTRTSDTGKDAFKLPAYSLLDAGLSYNFKVKNLGFTAILNANNILDEKYISDANDSSSATTVADLNGWYGLGTTWNAGLKVRF